MKYKIILNAIALFLLTSCTEQKIENGLTKANLKGKVKSTKETPYEAIEKFGEATKGNVYISGSYLFNDYLFLFSSIKHTTYNELGFETETKHYDAKGNILKRYIYNYNEKGGIINYSSYNPKGLEDKSTYTYKYDEKGNQIERSWHKSDGDLIGKEIYKYDEKGNKLESNNYNSEGELKEKTIYKYDEKGNNLESNNYNSEEELGEKWIYKYDEKGNCIESSRYVYGELDSKWIYKYDNKGNKIEESKYGEVVDEKEFKYKYDQKGNWIEKIEYENDVPKIIIEREIEYYQ